MFVQKHGMVKKINIFILVDVKQNVGLKSFLVMRKRVNVNRKHFFSKKQLRIRKKVSFRNVVSKYVSNQVKKEDLH